MTNVFLRHVRNCPACDRAPLGICPEGFKALGEASRMREDKQSEFAFVLPRPEPYAKPPDLKLPESGRYD